MKVFYILKPDMLERPEVIKEYLEIINLQRYVKNRKQFLTSSWVDLSCRLYDPKDKSLSKEQLIKLRSQLLTTIKGYDYLYQDGYAVVDIFDVPDDIEVLRGLEDIKYQIRNKYVLNTPKNYFRFLNLSSDILVGELKDISVRDLEVSHIKVNYDEDVSILGYQLAFLNCIHFPDPDIRSIDRDLEIIESSKVLTKKIKL